MLCLTVSVHWMHIYKVCAGCLARESSLNTTKAINSQNSKCLCGLLISTSQPPLEVDPAFWR